MSKKKEINLKSTPAAVESGDVNISYNNVLVGSLSDSGTAVLKTEMTICEHDIELEYTKPANTVTMPVYGLPRSGGQTPSLLMSYSGAPGIILEVVLQGNIDEITGVFAYDINDLDPEKRTIVPYYADANKVFITTLDPATVNPAYNSVIIRYSPGE